MRNANSTTTAGPHCPPEIEAPHGRSFATGRAGLIFVRMSTRDPRSIITPDAFVVAPDLLGIALARPFRRLVAIAIDGLLIAILANVGGKTLFTLLAGIMLWRGSAKISRSDSEVSAPRPRRNAVRVLLRLASISALMIFFLISRKWVAERMDVMKAQGDDSPNGANVEVNSDKVDIGSLGLRFSDVRIVSTVENFGDAEDSASAAPFADSLAHWVRTKPDSARERLSAGLVEIFKESRGAPALRASLSSYLPADTMPGDSLVRRYAELERRLNEANAKYSDMKDKYDSEKEGFSISKLMKSLSDILGFGIGWSALYFTAMTLLMRGQTPGKKLLGIRVIRLDGKPLTGWMSFERFGGYAASAATGLLGFAQILWDRNRQGLHDKATETVVIREINGVPVRPGLM
jgi:hypothetical protein